MSESSTTTIETAHQWAEAFIAGFRSPDTRRAYRRDLASWFTYCTDHELHPYDQSDRSYLRDPTFALMTATAR